MIEESELAKSIRKGEERMLESDIMSRALRCVDQLSSIQTTPSHSTPKVGPNAINSMVGASRAVTSELASIIQESNDAEYLEELLNVNDQLLNLLKKVPACPQQFLGFL
jgi:protein phosphatase 1 regulatory subunit 37